MISQQFSRSLPMMLYGALDAIMPRFRLIFKEFGLTEQQWRVLRVLWEHDDITVGELANITLISAPSLVGVTDRLMAAELLVKRRSRPDRRMVYITATKKGRELEQDVMPRVEATYAQLQESLDSATWEGLLDALEQVASIKLSPAQLQKTVNKQNKGN